MRFVYMLRAGENHYKVGISNNVLKRIQSIQTSNPHHIDIVTSRPVQNAEKVEQDLHIWLGEYHTAGGTEWFELDQSKAIDLIIKINNIEIDSDLTEYLAIRNLATRQTVLENKFKVISSQLALLPRAEELELKRQKFEAIKTTDDEYLHQAAEVVRRNGKASASLLQRRMSIGYARAARLLDQLEEAGIISSADGARPRDIIKVVAVPTGFPTGD